MIQDFLDELTTKTKEHLTTSIDVVKSRDFPNPGSLPLGTPNWKRIEDTVVVSADLKNSTAISYSKQDRVGARMYEASTGGAVRVVNQFEPDFVDIQGDGIFAIFHGERAHERAIAAAFTLKSFSANGLSPLLKEYLGEQAPVIGESGLKIGVAGGTLLAKRVGVRGEHNEVVWAGRPVNFATKCAAAGDRHDIIATKSVFDAVKHSDYIVFSCGCVLGQDASAPRPLWAEHEVEALGESHSTAYIYPGPSAWCVRHGNDFCAAILAGNTDRNDIDRSGLPPLKELNPAEPAEVVAADQNV